MKRVILLNVAILISILVLGAVVFSETNAPIPQNPLQGLSMTLNVDDTGSLILSNNRGQASNLSETAFLINQLHDLLLLKRLQAAQAIYGVYNGEK